jgi:S-ribosylhomocysteine lyase LuxS involved in autoinducer biosynthesis
MDGKQRKFRHVCHLAAMQLERLGYTVLKTATRTLTYDLIAFNDRHALFISVQRGKEQQNVKELIQDHYDIITDMQQSQVPYCTEKQFWVYQKNDEFTVYKLFENGIMRKQMID